MQKGEKNSGIFVDMHFHTKYSDGTAGIKAVKRKCDKEKIWVAITDHNEIEGAVRAYKENVPLIPGIEVRPSEGHDVLFYFNNISDLMDFFYKYVKPYRKRAMKFAPLKISLPELAEKAKSYNALISLAHPFGLLHSIGIKKSKTGYKPFSDENQTILSHVHAIEIRNGHILNKSNEQSLALALKLKKPYTAGSDGHALFDLGKVLTYANAKTPEGFLNAVRNKQNQVYERDQKLRKIVFSRSLALRKHIVHPFYYTCAFISKIAGKLIKRK